MELKARSDEELALALKAGDRLAFDELVRRHQGRVFAVAYRITLNRDDALDVAQEALLKAYRKIGAWRPTSGFLPWLLRVTANQAIDHIRRRKRRSHEELDEAFVPGASPEALTEGSMNTATRVHANEIDARVQGALGSLSPSQRAVFVMRHYEGMPLGDIAMAQGCTVGSVKVHLFRALRKLQVELKDLYET